MHSTVVGMHAGAVAPQTRADALSGRISTDTIFIRSRDPDVTQAGLATRSGIKSMVTPLFATLISYDVVACSNLSGVVLETCSAPR